MKSHLSLFGRLFPLMGLLFLLAACTSEPEPTPVPATAVVPTEEPTAVPTEEPTAEPTEEPTAVPTEEPTAEPTEEPTAEPTAETEASFGPAFTVADCEFDVPLGVDVTCGWLTTPEDHTDPNNSESIALHVAIFASDNPNPAPDPIVYLEGGPGGDALELIPLVFEQRFAPYLENHDLVLFDQRGTGYSQPSLACPEMTALSFELLEQDLPSEEIHQQMRDSLMACGDRLQDQSINLAAYNSAQSAADLNLLRETLGYEEWNVWGISYGTRLAQTAVRDFPQGIRSVVLDSAYPLEVNLLTDTPTNVDRAFDAFFDHCAVDAVCSEAYPDLQTVFFDTVAQLNEEKVILPLTNLLTGEQYDAYFSGDDLLSVLFQSLYSAEIITVLPKIIYDTNAGNYQDLSLLLSSFLMNSEFFSAGMQYSVQCREENLFTNIEDVRSAAEQHPQLLPIFEYSLNLGTDGITICDSWGAGMASAIENEPVISSIPTLVLAGYFDPITPPVWGEQVSQNLSNAYFYSFADQGHGVTASSECATAVMKSFLADPTTEPDSSCIADITGPHFAVAGQLAEVVLVPYTDEAFGISSLIPDGWQNVGLGVYARGQNALDQTVIMQQAAPGIPADSLLELLGSQLGWETAPEISGTYEAANYSWNLYETEVEGFPAHLALSDADGTVLLVLMLTLAEEEAALYEALFIPVLDAMTLD